jgi:uncharacterized protein YjiK
MKYRQLGVLFFTLTLLYCSSCDLSRKRTYKNTEIAPSLNYIAYNFDHPTKKYFLNADLEEISGLSYYAPNQLACVQDEAGKLFIYDLNRKRISKRLRFGKDGDYEGVEVVNGMIYVLHSDGKLFRFKLAPKEELQVDELKIDLPGKLDIEGLGYDPQRKSLLLAIKNQLINDDENVKEKAIYAYRLDSNRIDPAPVWLFRKKNLKKFLDIYESQAQKKQEEGEEHSKKKEREEEDLIFKPSGIAVHPKTGHLYIIASEGKRLLVVDRKGEIVIAVKLAPRMLKQPEGICFAPNGDLFIASEGREGDGFILKFNYQPKKLASKK